jgi:trypsin
MKLPFCALIFSFLFSAPGYAVIGGQDANIADFPWHVSLQSKDGHECGGSILSRNVILTAEHCLVSAVSVTEPPYTAPQMRFSFPDYTVKVGMTDLRETSVAAYPLQDSPILGRKFDSMDGHDISLVVLDGCLDYGPKVQPITVASPEESDRLVQPGAFVTAVGWGMSAYPDVYPFVLQRGELAVRSYEEADAATAGSMADYFKRVTGSPRFPRATLIAAGGHGVDTGIRDSGGSVTIVDPVTRKRVLVGITSWGADGIGAYVRVANFKNWIEKKVKHYSRRCR